MKLRMSQSSTFSSQTYNRSLEFNELKRKYNIEFRFNLPNIPPLQSIGERINEMFIHSTLKVAQNNLTLSKLRTPLATNEAMLNKRVLGILRKNSPGRSR